MGKPLYIFDIDGTLAKIDHRLYLLDQENNPNKWKEFYEACYRDEPNKPIIRIMDSLKLLGADVILFSGRSEDVRQQTIYWLVKHTSFSIVDLEKPGVLTMRPAGDYTPDNELKESWFNNMLLDDVDRIAAVFDDRDRVVNMWRYNKLTCLQVGKGNF